MGLFLREQAKIYNLMGIKDLSSLEGEEDDEQARTTVEKRRSAELKEKFSLDAMKTAVFVMEKFLPGLLSTLKSVQRTGGMPPISP